MFKIIYQTPLSVAVNAGRTCWQSQDKGGCYPTPTNEIVEADKQFLDRILRKHKHGSVAEHIRFVLESDSSNEDINDYLTTIDYLLNNKFTYKIYDEKSGKTTYSTNLRVLLEWKDEDVYTFSASNLKQELDENLLFLFED